MSEIEYTIPHSIAINQTLNLEYGDPYYGTLLGGDLYFSKRLRSDDWELASSGDKQKALFEATSMVDRLNFKGDKTVSTQILQFPRDGDTKVPRDIENAVYEIAILLLSGLDPDKESRGLEVASSKLGNISFQNHQFKNPLPYVVAGIFSSKAWRFLYPYIRDSRTVTLVRGD